MKKLRNEQKGILFIAIILLVILAMSLFFAKSLKTNKVEDELEHSVFSESDFSSLRRRRFIMRRTSSVSVYCFAISAAKIDIFCQTTKCDFTSLNGCHESVENTKSTL